MTLFQLPKLRKLKHKLRNGQRAYKILNPESQKLSQLDYKITYTGITSKHHHQQQKSNVMKA